MLKDIILLQSTYCEHAYLTPHQLFFLLHINILHVFPYTHLLLFWLRILLPSMWVIDRKFLFDIWRIVWLFRWSLDVIRLFFWGLKLHFVLGRSTRIHVSLRVFSIGRSRWLKFVFLRWSERILNIHIWITVNSKI